MINHKANCTHAQTPAARKACRKAAKTAAPKATLRLAKVGNGKAIHYIDSVYGTARCGKDQPVFVGMGNIEQVTCKGCAAKYGHAHG